MIREIFKNYEVFYNMVLSSTIMSNAQTDDFIQDAKKIITFIGNAYGVSDDFTAYCEDVILNELIKLGRTTDQQAVYGGRRLGDKYNDTDSLFDIKGDVLATLQEMGKEDFNINKGWFDYGHYKTYQAEVRFSKIRIAASSGNVIATRQTGVLLALGIGCEADCEGAIYRLKQCAFWGDIAAMFYLGKVYEMLGNENKSRIYYQLAELCRKYLYEGYTVLPEKVKANYSEEACVYYTYISSIKQDIVNALEKKNIDFSFLEAIFSDKLDYFDRIKYINDYAKQEWKDVTNSAAHPTKIVGFN